MSDKPNYIDQLHDCMEQIRASSADPDVPALFAVSHRVLDDLKKWIVKQEYGVIPDGTAVFQGIPMEVVETKERLLELVDFHEEKGTKIAVVGLPDEWIFWVSFMQSCRSIGMSFKPVDIPHEAVSIARFSNYHTYKITGLSDV